MYMYCVSINRHFGLDILLQGILSLCIYCKYTVYNHYIIYYRPTLKYFERISSSFLQVLKQIASNPSVDISGNDVQDVIYHLTAAVGLINHHDAITGL